MIKKGLITALITPFKNPLSDLDSDFSASYPQLDEQGLMTNIQYQLSQKCDGLTLLGTTGEATTLTLAEQKKILSLAVETIKGQVPLWVGTGSNCTKQTIEKTQLAQQLGADAALVIVPYYNKPTQEGLFQHFAALAKQTSLPLILYNNPSRCGVNLELSTVRRLMQIDAIKGIKEANSHLMQLSTIVQQAVIDRPDFLVFAGDDALALPAIALGAAGLVSILSNLLPKLMQQLVQTALKGNFTEARKLHHQLFSLFQATSLETNPIPIKAALNLCQLPAGPCRLPLSPLQPENLLYLKQLLATHPLLKK